MKSHKYQPKLGPADGSFTQSLLNYIASQELRQGEENASCVNEDPAKIMERAMLRQELNKALNEIGEKEAEIIRMRYLTDAPMALNGIAKKMKISRDRVRQIEECALLRLRRVIARMGLVELARPPIMVVVKPPWE